MADQLQILINTGFQINSKELQSTLAQIQKNSKLSLNIDIGNSNLSNLATQIKQVNQEMNNATKNSGLTQSQKNAEAFYNSVIEKTRQYKLGLMDLETYINKVQGQMYKKDGSYAPQFNNLEYTKQLEVLNNINSAMKQQQTIAEETAHINRQINASKKAEDTEKQKQAYQELNKLLTEEYNLRMRIEDSKLKRYQASDSPDEQKRITLLEQELREQLKVNQAKRDGITTNLNDNRLVNQEKLNQLVDRENKLKSELVIKQNQIASAQKISTEKAEYDLKMFQQSMNLQADGLGRRYSYVGGASAEIEKYRQALQGVTAENGKWYISQKQADGTMQKTAVTAQQLRMQYRQMRNEIQSNISIFDTLRQNMIKFSQYFFAGGFLVQGIRQVKEMFSYINQMDKYLTNVQIITGKTAQEVSGLTAEYQKLGKQLGITSQNIATVAEDFFRQGLNSSQITELTKATAQMATLAGMGMAEATENITSIKNGYKMSIEEVSKAVDSLVSIDNNAATSVEELSMALARSSNTAQEAGVDFDTLAGYIGVVSSTTRKSAETIGESMKSIMVRFQDIKLASMSGDGGWLNDGDSASNVEKTMEKIGIAFRNANGEFRSFKEVINDLSSVWATLDEESQRAVSKSMAGTYQRENFMVLLNNLSEATKLTEEATNSAGLAQDRYGIYLESTEAKINKLTVSMQELYTSLLDSGFINMFIDGTSGVLSFISALGGLPNLLMAIAGAMIIVKNQTFAIRGIGILDSLKGIGNILTIVGASVTTFGTRLAQTRSLTTAFDSALLQANLGMRQFQISANMAVVGIGALISVYSLIKMAQANAQRQHEEYIQSLKDSVDASKESATELNDLKGQYTELSQKQQKTAEDTKKLAEIQDKLIYKFGAKKEAIDLLNGSLEDNIALIDQLSQNDLRDAISAQTDIVKDAKNEWEKNNDLSFKLTVNDNDTLAEWDRMVDEMKSKYGEAVNIKIDERSGIRSISFDEEKMTTDEYVEALKTLKVSLQENYKLMYNTSGYSTFASSMGEKITLYDKMNEAVKTQIDLRRQELNLQDKSFEDISSNTDLNSLEGMKTSIEGKISLETDTTKLLMYQDLLDEIETQIKFVNNQKLNPDTKEAIISTEKLKSALESINTDSLSSDNTDVLADSLKTLQDGGKLTYEQFSQLVELFPNLATLFDECGDSAVDLGGRLEYVRKNIDDYGNQISNLNSAINSLSKGQTLSADTIVELIRQYPQLTAKVDEATGSWYIEKDALIAVKNQTIDTAKTQKQEEINKTKTTIEQTRIRISALSKELEALQRIASSKSGIEKYTSPMAGFMGQSLTNDLKGKIDGEKKSLTEDANYLKTLEEELLAIQVYSNDTNNSTSSSSKKDTNALKEKYDKLIAQILSSTDDVERAIEISRQKIEMAQLLGDKATEKKEEENIKSLYNTRKKLISEQANKLRALLKTVKDEEIRATIGENIIDLQNTYHDTQISLIEDRIELVKELHDATIEGLNDEIDLLNQQRTLMNEDTDEYQATYAKEYGIVLNQQLATIKSIKDLKAQGYSDESDAIKELEDEWKGYESTRLGIIKSIAEFNKQSQLDSLEKANDGLESLLDMTMDMVKQRYDDEKEMIQDLIDERENAVKKEIDGYKAIIEAKKKMLRDEQDDRNYQQGLSEKQTNISSLESRLSVLAKDDSDKAKAEYKKLYEELAKAKQELENYQYDHSIEVQEKALDEELQRYEDTKNAELESYKSQKEAELKALEDYSSKEVNIREEAMRLIKGKSKDFYDDLMEYNTIYGDGMTETVVTAWETGYTAMDKYNGGLYDVLGTLQKISAEMESINTAPLSQFVDTSKYDTSTSNIDTAIKNQTTTQQSSRAKEQLNQQKYLHNLMVEAQKENNTGLIKWIEEERKKWGN